MQENLLDMLRCCSKRYEEEKKLIAAGYIGAVVERELSRLEVVIENARKRLDMKAFGAAQEKYIELKKISTTKAAVDGYWKWMCSNLNTLQHRLAGLLFAPPGDELRLSTTADGNVAVKVQGERERGQQQLCSFFCSLLVFDWAEHAYSSVIADLPGLEGCISAGKKWIEKNVSQCAGHDALPRHFSF